MEATSLAHLADDATDDRVGLRAVLAGPLVAAVLTVVALIATGDAGVSFRDPDHVAAGYVLEVGAGVALLIWLDVLIRAGWRGRRPFPTRAMQRAVRRERWTRRRLVAVATALVSFYATYLAYRNLKGTLPLLRPGVLYDEQLASADKAIFLGHDPAVLLHDLIGSWLTTQVLSTFYAAFIVFLPLSLGLYLVFAPRLRESLLLATALSVNWVLGIASYFLLPSLGPAYSDPAAFAHLPHSAVTSLQQMLLDDRVGFLRHPATGTPQAIAAFASLHIAMSFTAVLAAHLLRLGPRVRAALWGWLAMTFLATVYFGWHFAVDDFAGLVIGAAALGIAALLTGFDLRHGPRRPSRARLIAPEPS